MIPMSMKRNGWAAHHIAGGVALATIAVILMRDVWADISAIAWRDEESSHIILVPMVFAWLIAARRSRLRQVMPTGQWLGPVMIAGGWGMWWYGFNHAVDLLVHSGAMVVLIGAACSAVGCDVLRKFAPAFGVLLFAIPVPGMIRQQIALPMQIATARVTGHVLDLLDVPVALAGSVLSINGIEVGIAEACNGLRMVFALMLVSWVFAFANPLRWYVRWIIILASPVTAIVFNVLRLAPTVWLYGNATRETADTFHDTSGWVMLIVAFFALLSIIRVLRWAQVPVTRYTLAAA